jgi:NTE family protein
MTTGLVLGGGGSRGLAHLGVLKVLQREGIPIDLLVGTSMGGLVGILFALGIPPERIISEMSVLQNRSLINIGLFSARARQRTIRSLLHRALEGKTFADLAIPTTLMAVDMVCGQEVALDEGPLMPAALATSAVPAIFPPIEIDGMQLADGGVIDSLATHVAFEMGADTVIAVDIEPPLEMDNPWTDPISAIIGSQLPLLSGLSTSSKQPGVLAAVWRAVRVANWHLHTERLAAHPPDVLLRPDVAQYGSLDFKDLQGPFMAGVSEAEQLLDALKAVAKKRPDPV